MEASDAKRPAPIARDSAPPADANDALGLFLRLFLGLRRGMLEFHRAYGLGEVEAEIDGMPLEELRRRLETEPMGRGIWMTVIGGIEDLMIHQASLLEAYQSATQHGSRALLDRLDPERIREAIGKGGVRVGPVTLSPRFAPVLMQAVWEEFLRRFSSLGALDPADFERFYRDGFRDGYREFRAARAPRPAPGSDMAGSDAVESRGPQP